MPLVEFDHNDKSQMSAFDQYWDALLDLQEDYRLIGTLHTEELRSKKLTDIENKTNAAIQKAIGLFKAMEFPKEITDTLNNFNVKSISDGTAMDSINKLVQDIVKQMNELSTKVQEAKSKVEETRKTTKSLKRSGMNIMLNTQKSPELLAAEHEFKVAKHQFESTREQLEEVEMKLIECKTIQSQMLRLNQDPNALADKKPGGYIANTIVGAGAALVGAVGGTVAGGVFGAALGLAIIPAMIRYGDPEIKAMGIVSTIFFPMAIGITMAGVAIRGILGALEGLSTGLTTFPEKAKAAFGNEMKGVTIDINKGIETTIKELIDLKLESKSRDRNRI